MENNNKKSKVDKEGMNQKNNRSGGEETRNNISRKDKKGKRER